MIVYLLPALCKLSIYLIIPVRTILTPAHNPFSGTFCIWICLISVVLLGCSLFIVILLLILIFLLSLCTVLLKASLGDSACLKSNQVENIFVIFSVRTLGTSAGIHIQRARKILLHIVILIINGTNGNMIEFLSALVKRIDIDLWRITMLLCNLFISIFIVVVYQDVIACCILYPVPTVSRFIGTKISRLLQNIEGIGICLNLDAVLTFLHNCHLISTAYFHNCRRIKAVSTFRLYRNSIGIGFFDTVLFSVHRKSADFITTVQCNRFRLKIGFSRCELYILTRTDINLYPSYHLFCKNRES